MTDSSQPAIRLWQLLLAAVASGLLLGLTFRPNIVTPAPLLGAGPDFGLLVWIAVVPLMWAVARARGAWSATLAGYVAATLWFWLTCRFLLAVHPAAFWLCGPIFGLYGAALAALMRRLWRLSPAWTVLTWPTLWIAGDWLWASVGIKFPWFYLAYGLIDADPWIAQTADLFGVTGTTFIIVSVNALLARLLLLRPQREGQSFWHWHRRAVVATAALVVAGHIYGAVRQSTLQVEDGPVAALLQANMSLAVGRAPDRSQIVQRMLELMIAVDAHREPGTAAHPTTTFAPQVAAYPFVRDHLWTLRTDSAGDDPVDLVVLPETLYPWGYREVLWAEKSGYRDAADVQGTRSLLEIARRNGWHVQLNAMEYDLSRDLDEVPPDQWYDTFRIQNCTLLVAPDARLLKIHAKQELVPVGEYVPLRDTTSLLRDVTIMLSGLADPPDLLPGVTSTVFEVPVRSRPGTACPYGVAICFETCFPDLCRRFAAAGSRLLLVQSNDAWFMRDPMDEPAQIWLGARYRAIESRVAVARCVNSGISGVCGPDGAIRDVFEVETAPGRVEQHGLPGALITRLPMGPGTSLYVLVGDVLPICALVVTLVLLAASVVVFRRRRQESFPGPGGEPGMSAPHAER